jgi:murein L,D-transpeptidase YafK
MKYISAGLAIILLIAGCGHSQESLKNYSLDLGFLIDSMDIAAGDIHVGIDKSDYTLSLFAGTRVIKQYPVVFGSNPVKDKLRQGDRCTPEGEFLVRTKYPHRRWEKFIWINYPTAESWEKHRKAKREGIIEESDGIGGEIGIHGVPFGMDYMIDRRMNWTLGCISLKNKDINEIYPYLSAGSRVLIEK